MKYISKIVFILSIVILFHFSFLGINFNKTDLIVHEWGTFTSTHLPDGKYIEGQRFEGRTSLPNAVYTLVDATIDKKNIRKEDLAYKSESGYGFGRKGSEGRGYQGLAIKNDTIRMETPVLYFYSPKAMKLDVSINFPQGSIGEWYPQRKSGEIISSEYIERETFDDEESIPVKPLDLKNHTGFISWQANILDSNAKNPFTINTKVNEWVAPRQTDSNLIQIGTEIEKYIFYRGIASFDVPIQTKLTKTNNQTSLSFKNIYSEKIPFIFVLNNQSNSIKTKSVVWKGSLNSNDIVEKNIISEGNKIFDENDIGEFKSALEAAGLYPKEAEAMMNTWKKSYFETKGTTIFWIVPDKLINQLLPINFSTKPDEFKRVFVGRIKIAN